MILSAHNITFHKKKKQNYHQIGTLSAPLLNHKFPECWDRLEGADFRLYRERSCIQSLHSFVDRSGDPGTKTNVISPSMVNKKKALADFFKENL